MVYDIITVNRTEDLLYHLKILNLVMKLEEENAQQVCTYTYALIVTVNMVSVLYLDDILLRYADETNVTEHRSLIPRQPSVDCVLSPVPTPLKLHQNPYKIEIESTVQYGEPPLYGVIKWIGVLPGRENLYAGVEMVSYI